MSSGAYLKMSVQEQAGINTATPGRTEYMQRYHNPPVPDVADTPDYQINPSPNFGVYGRPMATGTLLPCFTENQQRYECPDSEKIVTTPWLRK